MKTAALVAVFFLCASAIAQPCPVITFESVPAHYAGSQQPRTFDLADFDGDPWPDAIVGSEGRLVLLRGHRGGHWSVITELAHGLYVSHVAAVDYDGDGDDDVAYFMATLGTALIGVLRNDGAGFTYVFERSQYGNAAGGLAAGDFNGDHREDLVFTNTGESSLLLMSAGDGTFATSSIIPATQHAPVVADLNGDGFDDVAIGDFVEPRVHLFAGSAGGLQARPPVALHDRPSSLVIGDFDGSGTLDVVATHQDRVTFDTIYDAARPSQHVSPQPTLLHVSALNRPAGGDLDGNGVDDLVWFDWRGVEAAFFQRGAAPAVGDNWFLPGRISGGYFDKEIATADLDRDGDLDVVIVTEDGLRTLFNDGTGKFGSPKFATRVRATGDFNHDGRDDLLGNGEVLLAGPNGEFDSVPHRTAFEDQSVIRAAAADVDGDGHLDVVQLLAPEPFETSYRVFVSRGRGDGTTRPVQELALEREAEHMLVRDFTGDGRADLLITNDGFLASLYVSNGDGTFAPERTILNLRGRNVAAGDVDGDDDLDLIGDLTFLNDGAGQFTPAGDPGSGLRFDPILGLGDLNGDGRDDVVVALFGSEIRVFLSTGGGEVQLIREIVTGLGEVRGFQVRDFNGDGHADVLVTEGPVSSARGFLELYFGDGTGNFPRHVRMRSASTETVTGDFNGDGLLDLADAGHIRLASCAQAKRRPVRH